MRSNVEDKVGSLQALIQAPNFASSIPHHRSKTWMDGLMDRYMDGWMDGYHVTAAVLHK